MDVVKLFGAYVRGLEHIQVTHYAQLASSSIIVYDHLITLGDEIELIWFAPWSWAKLFFLLNRYYSLAATIFNNYGFFSSDLTESVSHFCLRFFKWQGWTGLIGCILAEAILQMRLYALYSRNKKVLVLMLIAYFGSLGTSGWIMGSVLSTITTSVLDIPGGKFCVPHGVLDHFYVFWIPMLGFECLLCSLALLRGFQTLKLGNSMYENGRKLVELLVRDSILYFLVICATYATCLVVWIILPVSLLEVPIGFSIALSCVLSNRILLNVRRVASNKLSISIPRCYNISDSKYTSGKGGLGWETSFCSPGVLTAVESAGRETGEEWVLEVPILYNPRPPHVRTTVQSLPISASASPSVTTTSIVTLPPVRPNAPVPPSPATTTADHTVPVPKPTLSLSSLGGNHDAMFKARRSESVSAGGHHRLSDIVDYYGSVHQYDAATLELGTREADHGHASRSGHEEGHGYDRQRDGLAYDDDESYENDVPWRVL